MDTPYNPDEQSQEPDPYAQSLVGADSKSVQAMTDSLYRVAPGESLVTTTPGQRKQQSSVRSLYEFANKHLGGFLDPAVRGVNKGFNEMGKSIAGGMAAVGSALGADESNQQMKNLRTIQRDGLTVARMADAELGPDQNTGLHAFVRDAAQFATVNEVLGGAGIVGGTVGKVKAGIRAVQGGIAMGVGFDPRAKRLSNMLENAPLGVGYLARKLAANPDDSEAEARFKATLEGIVLNSTIDGAVHGIKVAGGKVAAKMAGSAVQEAAAALPESGAVRAAPEATPVASTEAAATAVDQPIPPPVETKPMPEPFGVEDTGLGQHRVVLKDAAYADAMKEHMGDTAPLFDNPQDAESAAASLNYATRNAQRPKVDVTPEQAGHLRNLAELIKQTGTAEGIQTRLGDANFRYDLNPEEIGHTISAVSTMFRQEMAASRLPGTLMLDPEGKLVISHAETVAKGAQDFAGKTPDQAVSDFHKSADALDQVPSQIVAARVLRTSVAQQAEQLARAMDADNGNLVAHQEYTKAANTLLHVFMAEKRLTSGAGRALNATQIVTGAKGAAVDGEAFARAMGGSGDPLDSFQFHLVDEPVTEADVKGLDAEAEPGATPQDGSAAPSSSTAPAKKPGVYVNPRQLRAMARQMMFSPRNEKERDQVLNALLGNVRLATESDQLVKPSLWQKVSSYRAWSMLSAPTTPIVNFMSAMSTSMYRPVEGVLGALAKGDLNEAKRYGDVFLGTFRAMADGFEQARSSWDAGESQLAGRDAAVPQVGNGDGATGAVATLMRYARVNERLMTSGDEFAQQVSYRGHVYAQSLENARRAGITDPEQIAQRVQDDIKAAFNDQGRGMNPSALDYAQDVTLRRDIEYGVGKVIDDAAKKVPVVRALFPFTRIPINLARFQMDRAPGLGLLTHRNRVDLAAGGSQATEAVGRQVAGTIAWGMAAMLHHSGIVTGGGPKDPELRRQWMNVYQPYSVKLPGTDTWVSYRRFEPLSTTLGIVADFMDAAGEIQDGGDVTKAVESFAAGVSSNQMSKTYLKTLSDFFYAVGSGKAGGMDSLIDGFVGSFIPNVVQKLNPDDTMRQTRDFVDKLHARIPGYSETLEPRRNIYGEKVLKPGSMMQRMFNPFTVRDDKADETDIELLRLGEGISMPLPKKYGVDLQDRSLGIGNQSPYDRWLELMSEPLRDGGSTLRDALRELIKSDKYQSLTDNTNGYKGSRVIAVERVIRGYRQAAFGKMIRENPKLLDNIKAEAMKRGAALSADPDVVEALTGNSTDQQLRGHAAEAAALLGTP